MKTQQEALTWLHGQIGQHLDYDHKYGDQCVDFFNFYYQFVTGDGPFLDGYKVVGAKSLFGVVNSRLSRIPDSNTLVPQPGDIAVYGATWGNGLGHVEVCIQSDAHGAFFLGENEHGNPSEGVVKVYRTWAQMRGLEGVLRFHFSAPAAAPAPAAPVVQAAAPAAAPAPAVTKYLNFPTGQHSFWTYNVGGPYDQEHHTHVLTKAAGVSYPIVQDLGNGLVVIPTKMYGHQAVYAADPLTVTEAPQFATA